MSILISCNSLSKSFGAKDLFGDLSLSISDGDAVGIIGANGTGKSTLLKIMMGEETADGGTISRRKFINIAYLSQVSDYDPDMTVWAVVAESAKEIHALEDIEVRIAKSLSLLGFLDKNAIVSTLSGGWKKRLGIACCIVNKPDLILFDEPTNHLDIEGLLWFEKLLKSSDFTWAIVSHDRYFLEKTTNRIIDIDKMYDGGCFSVDGPYSYFLEKRAEYIENTKQQEASLASKVRREVEWLRCGPKARTTKAKYRIDEANSLIDELSDIRNKMITSKANISFSSSNRKSKQLVVLTDICKSYSDKEILKDFNFTIVSGLNIGILGANGIGKSTLLKLINKQIEPDSGTIKQAEGLKIVYFDQYRETLNPKWTLKMALSENNETVVFKGQSIHIVSWAKRFQFRPEQIEAPISRLSGGEQARVMIARLMLKPADILLLDEPTNDLDIQTLNILEESLLDFPGAVILITHDRYMMNKTCNLFIGFTGDSQIDLFADYSQWESALLQNKKEETSKKSSSGNKKKGMSYKEKQDLQGMEQRIQELEAQIEAKQKELSLPQNSTNFAMLEQLSIDLKTTQDNLDALYNYWDELERKSK